MVESRRSIVLVNGLGQPLADALARRFSRAGESLAVTYLPEDAERARAVAESLGATPALECDAADPEAVRTAVRRVAAELGGLDVMINATTQRRNGPAHLLSDEDWRRVIDVELSGTLYFCREAVRPMMRQRSGRIINLTDVSGMRGEAQSANHSAARGGVMALTRALASELAPRGIYVNALGISYLSEELDGLVEESRKRLMENTPLGRAGSGDEVAEAAFFLASAAASFTTGHVLQVNGGLYL